MDVTEILAIGGTSTTVAGGTLWGFVKMWYKLNEGVTLLKQRIHYLESQCKTFKGEIDKIETDINNKHDVLSEKFNHLELKIEQNKSEIIREIHELMRK